jgi:hypothetical protein
VTNEVPTAKVELNEYSSVPPPPSQPSIDQQHEESLSRNVNLEETGDLEVEDLAAIAFQERKKFQLNHKDLYPAHSAQYRYRWN